MTDMLGPLGRDLLTLVGILLNAIIGLLIYIFHQRVERTQVELNAVKATAQAEMAALRIANEKHEKTNESDMKEVADALVALKEQITNLHVTLPSEYVKQTVLAALQMDIKADMRTVFSKMDEMKNMLVNMGAERRQS